MPLRAVKIFHRIVCHIDRALRKAGPHVRYSELRPWYSTTEPGEQRRSRGDRTVAACHVAWEAVNVLGRGRVGVWWSFGIRVCKDNEEQRRAIEAMMRTRDLRLQ